MSEKCTVDLSSYDNAFILAYSLVQSHIEAGNAVTADLATCLAELTEVIRKRGEPPVSPRPLEPRT